MRTKTTTTMNICLAVLLVALALLTRPVSAEEENQFLNKKIQNLSLKLEQKRKDFHIPGMAIVIVKDNKIVLSQGFGVTDLKKQTPVTPKTLFGIGSTTKAFTANLIAMLVDEGKMSWDDPITKHLPHLQFKLANQDDEITIRDMMSHRTGFTRFNLLYANGKVSRDDMLNAATKAEPWTGFREKFLYTNLMVTGAGVAAAHSVNSNWEELLENRLLKPLGMKSTTARFDTVQKSLLLSTGYMWQEEQNKHKKLNMHNITSIGPAGAINSNVEDMAQWLKMQLNQGSHNDIQLVSKKQIQQTWSPQIKVANQAAYGLGWMMREFQGQKLVAHDGSVEGYSAIVALLPESKMGFVLLTNLTQTQLLGESVGMVFDTLLEKEEEKITTETTKNPVSYNEYVGQYLANFGSFSNTLFDFHIKQGVAYLNVPGQTDYELLAPDANGLMYFKATNTVSVSFDKNEKGNVNALRMHQGGMDFELQKIGMQIIAEIDEQKLQKYVGQYASELFKGDLTVKIQNYRLAVHVPGQMTFELHLPDDQNRRHFRIKDVMSVEFETGANNEVIALSTYQSDNKIDTAKKVIETNAVKLPTVDDILKLRKTEQRILALKESGGFRLKGQITMKQSGIVGQVTSIFEGYNNFREEIDFGQYGSIITALNSTNAAIAPSFAAFMEQHGKYYQQARYSHPAALINWHHYYDEIEVTSATVFNDKEAFVIRLSGGKAPDTEITVDAETGDTLKQQSKMLNPTLGSIPVVTTYENYKEKFGLRIPFKVTVKNDFNGESNIELDHIESNLQFKPGLFKLSNPQSGE